MKIENIVLSPDDFADLANHDVANAPDWYPKLSSPLTYSPFWHERRHYEGLHLGNSGLQLEHLFTESHLQMSFNPNGDFSQDREGDGDETRNIGIWVIGFQKFLECKNLFFPKLNIIEGVTNDAMLSVRLKLINSLYPKAMTVKGQPDDETFKINIRKCLAGLQSPSYDSSLFSKVARRYHSLEGNLEVINPRLQKSKLDPLTGKYIYTLEY